MVEVAPVNVELPFVQLTVGAKDSWALDAKLAELADEGYQVVEVKIDADLQTFITYSKREQKFYYDGAALSAKLAWQIHRVSFTLLSPSGVQLETSQLVMLIEP